MANLPNWQYGPTGPVGQVFLITPDDSNDLAIHTRGFSFASVGAIKVLLEGDTVAVVIPSGALAAGLVHPLRIKRLYSTGTTATNLVGYS